MTVQELKEILSCYPDDMTVGTTWEGTYHSIQPDSLYLRPVAGDGELAYLSPRGFAPAEILLIDADGGSAEDYAHYGAISMHSVKV